LILLSTIELPSKDNTGVCEENPMLSTILSAGFP
jgi:hypothetical protein